VLEKELQRIRKQGCAVDNFVCFKTSRGVAVAVFDMDGHPLLAMLCLGELERDAREDERLAQQMQSPAREMSEYIALMGDVPKASTEFAK
jgi:DNA-binding IclR family transcriptional regulator